MPSHLEQPAELGHSEPLEHLALLERSESLLVAGSSLAVMSGFQDELRTRILGMVAHATVSGLDAEGEDIRGHLVDRAELTRMALDGRIVNGPLLILALWLDREAGALRARHPAAAG